MEENKLNKRKIAIFADIHGLLEPTIAVLNDIKKRGITEIYSLGDNIGVGPNPNEVINSLLESNVISLAGNAEEYINLGMNSFHYFNHNEIKRQSYIWTLSKLGKQEKNVLSTYPHSIELVLGGKRVGLCHFANDVRFDYRRPHCSITYQDNYQMFGTAYEQFLYTNSKEQLKMIKDMIEEYGVDNPLIKGYLSAKKDPLFDGKRVDCFDAVIQGHVHWKIYEKSSSIDFYSIRALGMAYGQDPINTASYVILTEKENGFDFEEVLVEFDRDKMEQNILSSDSPDHTIKKFVKMITM